MNRRHCLLAGCNYPEGGCSGACLHTAIDTDTADTPGTQEARRVEDSTTAAGLCLLGIVALALVGSAFALAMLLVDFVGWHLPRFFN